MKKGRCLTKSETKYVTTTCPQNYTGSLHKNLCYYIQLVLAFSVVHVKGLLVQQNKSVYALKIVIWPSRTRKEQGVIYMGHEGDRIWQLFVTGMDITSVFKTLNGMKRHAEPSSIRLSKCPRYVRPEIKLHH
jgi:hypothetical protein